MHAIILSHAAESGDTHLVERHAVGCTLCCACRQRAARSKLVQPYYGSDQMYVVFWWSKPGLCVVLHTEVSMACDMGQFGMCRCTSIGTTITGPKSTANSFTTLPSIVIDKVPITVPNKKAYVYMRDIEANDKP